MNRVHTSMPNVSEKANERTPRAGWRFVSSFYIATLSIAPITAAIAWVAGDPLHVDDMLLTVVLGLGIVNLWGAREQSRLVRRTHQGSIGVATGIVGLRELPLRCARWMCLLVMVFLGGHHALAHSALGWSRISELVYPLALIAVYAVLMGVFQYFAVGALVAAARRMKGWMGASERAPTSRLGRRLVAAVAATAFVPLALVLVHREVGTSMPPHHAPDLQVFLRSTSRLPR